MANAGWVHTVSFTLIGSGVATIMADEVVVKGSHDI
jgi:hypothetical protein